MVATEKRFQACLAAILEHEGGLTNNENDPGGITNWGISLRFLKHFGLDLNKDGTINEDDVINISEDTVESIYRKCWWDKYQYAKFNDLIVVEKVFDTAVNMGPFGAHKILQIAINRLNDNPIKVDGILGDLTFEAANKTEPNNLRQELRNCQEHRYVEILAENPKMEWARKGWIIRSHW